MSRPARNTDIAFHRLDGDSPFPKGEFVALAPGADVPYLDLELPAGLTGAAREDVARRMVLDRIGGDRGGTEVRYCQIAGAAEPWTRVVVADKARLALWRRRLEPTGARCRALLPDYLGLPAAKGLWTVQTAGEGVIVRLDLDDGFAAEDGLAAMLLQKALAKGPVPKAVLRLGGAAPATDAVLAGAKLRLVSDPARLTGADDPHPVTLGHSEAWFDLSKDLGAATDRLEKSLLEWRVPAVLGLAALVIWSLVQWTALAADRDIARIDRARAETLARTHFVPDGPILDIRAQVVRALEDASRAATGPVNRRPPTDLFRDAAEIIVARQARLISVAYLIDGNLSLTVETANFAELDQLTQAIAAGGTPVVLTGAGVLEAGGVTGVLNLNSEARGQ